MLTVRSLGEDTAKVTVRAEYPKDSGKYYFADFTANKVQQDKYDLILTPNSIPYNPDSAPAGGVNITPRVIRTDLQGNTQNINISTTEEEKKVCLYYGFVNVDGTIGQMTLLTTASLNINGSSWGYSGVFFELRKLISSSDNVWTYRMCDQDTVPFAKSLNGGTGQNAVRLDLDNENDTMLYDGQNALLSGDVTTTATLFDGDTDVSSQAVFSILSYEGMGDTQLSIEGRTVTVTGMTDDVGFVIVKATYKGHDYLQKFSLKKLVGTDKYDIVVTPNSVGVNTSNTVTDTVISVKAFRTPANGGERSVVRWIKTGGEYKRYGLSLDVKDSLGNVLAETTSGSSAAIRTFNLTGTMATNADNVLVTLLKDDTIIMEAETVPVTHVRNGVDGSGSNAVRIDLDNSMDSIPCDATGKVMATIQLSTVARIYDGASPVSSGITVSSIGSIAGIQAVTDTTTPGVVAIIWEIPANTILSAGKYTAPIALRWNNQTYYATFVASAVKSGAAGVTPVIKQLIPNPSQVVFKRDNSGTIPSTRINLSLQVKVTDGDNTSMADPVDSGLNIRFSYQGTPAYNGGIAWPSNNNLSISSSITYGNIYLAAYDSSNNLVDSEVVPIIKDGENGENGNDAVEYKIDFKDTTFIYNPNTRKNQVSIKGVIYKSIGSEITQLGNITTSMFNMRFLKANGDVVRNLSPDTDFGVENGVFITTNGSGLTNAEEHTFIVEFKPDGTHIATQAALTINNSGENGLPGEHGKMGRFYYYAKEWENAEAGYRVTDAEAPFFKYNNTFYVFNPEETGWYTIGEMGTPGSNDNWELMTSIFRFFMAEVLFAEFAHLGAFIINGDFLLTQEGLWSSDYDSEEGSSEVDFAELFIGSDNAIHAESSSATKFTLIDIKHPETRITNIKKVASIEGQTGSAIDESDTEWIDEYRQLEPDFLYDISYDTKTNCDIYLRYYTGENFKDTKINIAGSTHSLFKVEETINVAIVVKPSDVGRFQINNYSLDIRNFSPNVAINGKTGQAVMNNIFSRGTFYGNGNFDEIISRSAFLHGLTVIDQPKVVADYPGDTHYSTEQQWINNMGVMPVMPKYKRVAVITKDSYGQEHINELGWIEIDSNGYLKYTQKTSIN